MPFTSEDHDNPRLLALVRLLDEYGLFVAKTANTPRNVGKHSALVLLEMLDRRWARIAEDPHAPREGQPAVILALTPNGPYFGRFPYEAAGGRELADLAARRYHHQEGMGKQVRLWHFTGRFTAATPIFETREGG